MKKKPIFNKIVLPHGRVCYSLNGSELYKQLSVSIEDYNIETMDEIIEEVTKVVRGEISQTDFSSGETTDFVEVYKEESRLYPVFEEDEHLKIPTSDLLDVLHQWKDFISNPPKDD